MKKYQLLFVFLLVTASGFSQSVNDYQYVIVPTQFSIFNAADKYRLNTTTKMLLEKYGFKTFMSNEELPLELGDNCKKLYADLVQDRDFMVTKVKLVLKDCKEKVVYETDLGKSREKDYAVAYNQALRETAKSFDKLNYRYNGKNGSTSDLPETKLSVSDQTSGKVDSLDVTPVKVQTVNSSETFYFAQPTATGFQVIDTTPKVIMRLFTTSQKNVFIGQKDKLNGVVITRGGEWFFEYYENGKLMSELLKLKF